MALSPQGERRELSDEAVSSLREKLGGPLLTAQDEGYDRARRVWNGMIDRRPALIAQCAGTADVVECVNFARENDLLVSVRGGGHNVAGHAVCDGGLVIDLSAGMRSVLVDSKGRTASVQGGATWADVDRETQVHGLITPGGQISKTGVGGLTLGGGLGNVRRKWGLSADNLLAAEVVTADGRVRRASQTENPDLFWAIRGGGGNFGVVTRFEFQLHPLGPEVYVPAPAFSIEEAPRVFEAWRAFVESAPPEATSELIFWNLPALPALPAELHGAPVVIFYAMYAGLPEEGEEVFRPVAQAGTPLVDLGGHTTYLAAQSDLDPLLPDGHHYYWKALTFDRMDDEISAWILDQAKNRPTASTMHVLQHMGGRIADVAEDATPYANRSARFNYMLHAHWTEDEDAEAEPIVESTRNAWRALRSKTGGRGYVNFGGFREDAGEVAEAAYGEKRARLREVKRAYDPTNLFRMNVNIAPDEPGG